MSGALIARGEVGRFLGPRRHNDEGGTSTHPARGKAVAAQDPGGTTCGLQTCALTRCDLLRAPAASGSSGASTFSSGPTTQGSPPCFSPLPDRGTSWSGRCPKPKLFEQASGLPCSLKLGIEGTCPEALLCGFRGTPRAHGVHRTLKVEASAGKSPNPFVSLTQAGLPTYGIWPHTAQPSRGFP